jgi:adenylate cyclase
VGQLRSAVESEQRQSLDFAAQMWAELSHEENPDDPEIAEDYERFRKVHELVTGPLAALDEANEALAAKEGRWLDKLRSRIEGKICFVGYTATAVADMVTTPPFGRLPGVMVHSNLYNNFMTGSFMRAAPGYWAVPVVILAGLLSVAVTVGSRPWAGLFGLLVLVAVAWSVNAFVFFSTYNVWVPWVTAVTTAGLAWAMVVLVRYLATERQRRRFSRALAQYVSPAVARQIADSQVDFSLTPAAREVSCFFSDLAGFTATSERLGPAGTREVLNPYLEAMSEALHGHGALINKFMGDGIFAFFNPPILACPGHARAACLSAVDCRQQLAALEQRYRHHSLADEFAGLRMRIGLASGPVYVGDYGSESKLDYTCMGDTVNLAARLESANKQFGTHILADDTVRSGAGEGLIWRYLGLIRVVGQSTAMPVHELIGQKDRVDNASLQFAESFEAAVRAFAARQWDQAERLMKACAEDRPLDASIVLYLELIEQYRHHPPKEGWSGQVELREK